MSRSHQCIAGDRRGARQLARLSPTNSVVAGELDERIGRRVGKIAGGVRLSKAIGRIVAGGASRLKGGLTVTSDPTIIPGAFEHRLPARRDNAIVSAYVIVQWGLHAPSARATDSRIVRVLRRHHAVVLPASGAADADTSTISRA